MAARILVIEDEPENRLLIGLVLRNEGYDVLEAEDGTAGLVAAERHRPDLILLDVMMPGINGFEVYERLQQHPCLRAIPVLMLTALAQRAEMERAVEMGVAGYLTKPFEPNDLLAAIAGALASARERRTAS